MKKKITMICGMWVALLFAAQALAQECQPVIQKDYIRLKKPFDPHGEHEATVIFYFYPKEESLILKELSVLVDYNYFHIPEEMVNKKVLFKSDLNYHFDDVRKYQIEIPDGFELDQVAVQVIDSDVSELWDELFAKLSETRQVGDRKVFVFENENVELAIELGCL